MASNTRNDKNLVLWWIAQQPVLHPHLSPKAILFLLTIGDYWNAEERSAWPHQELVSERTHLSIASIGRAIRELELRQILIRGPRVWLNSGRKSGNYYAFFESIDGIRAWRSEYEALAGVHDKRLFLEDAQVDIGQELLSRLKRMSLEELRAASKVLPEAEMLLPRNVTVGRFPRKESA